MKRSSNANKVGNQPITASAHTAHDDHILRSCKGSIPAAMFNDAQCNDPTDPWQTFELGGVGEVDIDPFRPRNGFALDCQALQARVAQAK